MCLDPPVERCSNIHEVNENSMMLLQQYEVINLSINPDVIQYKAYLPHPETFHVHMQLQ